ncbi:amidase family protein [Amycolatopsis sp. NPDC059027]|uniref:amidase family protein n=1 Tax=Amycolatopsis sp. NPDC059027 TaxID=3346709 RepID=UPI00366A78BC
MRHDDHDLHASAPEWAELVERARESATSHGAWIAVGTAPGARADGPLAGIPLAVKDNIDVAGFATTAGSPLFDGSVANADAGVVSALKAAGATVLGKTNLHELAFGITSDNAFTGPVRHPRDPSRSAGGSSGGSAVAVALGAVPIGLGTDTGGSVTIPSAFCGIVGFRPSTGRYPGGGLVNLSHSRDTVGVHARTVHDVRIVDEVITGTSAPREPLTVDGLRIGVLRNRFHDLDPAVAATAHAALAVLEEAGAKLVDVEVRDDLTTAIESGIEIVRFECARLLRQRLVLTGSPLATAGFDEIASRVASPDVRALIEGLASAPVTAERYAAACAARWRLRSAYREAFETSGAEAFLWPTCPVPPARIGENDTVVLNGRTLPRFPAVIRNTEPGTVAGQPALAVPAPIAAGALPVGMCLEGRIFEDGELLRIATAVEAVFAADRSATTY